MFSDHLPKVSASETSCSPFAAPLAASKRICLGIAMSVNEGTDERQWRVVQHLKWYGCRKEMLLPEPSFFLISVNSAQERDLVDKGAPYAAIFSSQYCTGSLQHKILVRPFFAKSLQWQGMSTMGRSRRFTADKPSVAQSSLLQ